MAPVSEEGYTAPTGRELIDQLREAYETESGTTPDWDRDQFFGAITAAVGSVLGDLSEGTQEIADQRSVQNATGRWLDEICQLVGIYRQEATASVVDLTLTGTNGTIVPEGSIVEDDRGNKWVTQEDATLDETGVVAQASETGPIAAPANTVWSIVTPVSGWTGVENPANGTPGEARETDAELLKRRTRSLQRGTTATVAGIFASADGLPFVKQALAIENDSRVEKTVEGLTMPAKSWTVVIFPSTLTTEDKTELAKVLLETAPAGVENIGSQSRRVSLKNGQSFDMRWEYATDQNVAVDVTFSLVTGATATTSDVETQITNAVDDYFGSLKVGEDVRYHEAFAGAFDIEAKEQLDDIDITLDGGTANVSVVASKIASPTTTFS